MCLWFLFDIADMVVCFICMLKCVDHLVTQNNLCNDTNNFYNNDSNNNDNTLFAWRLRSQKTEWSTVIRKINCDVHFPIQ